MPLGSILTKLLGEVAIKFIILLLALVTKFTTFEKIRQFVI